MADTQIVMMPYSCWHIAVAGAFHFEAFLKERKIAARYRTHRQMTEKNGYEYKLLHAIAKDGSQIQSKTNCEYCYW